MNVLPRKHGETGRAYALRAIKSNIVDLTLEPGAMISENDLAEQLGLSRTPVREALMELAGVGIIEIYPQKGSRVSLIDDKMVDEARFLRLRLETGVVRQLCGCGETALALLDQSVQTQRFYLENGTEAQVLEQDNAFHKLLFELVEKGHCYELIHNMEIHFDRIRTLTGSAPKNRRNIQEHEDLTAAIRRGDGDLAERIMETHLSHYKVDEEAVRADHPDYFKSN